MAARVIGTSLLLLFPLVLTAPPAFAAIAPVGKLGGTYAYDWEIVDGYVYIATGVDFAVYAASGTLAPLARFSGRYESFIRLGSRMLAGRAFNYVLFDISSPATPVQLGPVSGNPPPLGDFDAATQRYYGLDLVVDQWNLKVYDVSEPSALALLGTTLGVVQQAENPNPYGSAYTAVTGAVIEQGRFYEQHHDTYWDAIGAPLGGEVRLQVFSLADPGNAQLIDSQQLTQIEPGDVTYEATFAVDGNRLYTSATHDYCCNADVVRVYDVDDVLGLVELASLPADPELGPLELHGVTVMEFDSAADKLRLWGFEYGEVDVSVAQSPQLSCVLPATPAPAYDLQGGKFVTNSTEGLGIYDPDCADFHAAALVPISYAYHEAVVAGGVLYLGSLVAAVVDLQDVTNPYVRQNLPMPTTIPAEARWAVPAGAYHVAQIELTTSTSALRIVDLTAPGGATYADFTIPEPATSPAAYMLASNGTIVGYLRQGPQNKSSLQLVDVSDPADPSLEGAYSRASSDWVLADTHDLAMLGDVAYVSVLDHVWVIDFSNLNAPQLATTLSASGLAGASQVELSIAGSLLVTSDTDDHRLWSLANPLAPALVGALPLPAAGTRIDDVEAVGGLHFLWHDGILHAFDLTQPAAPVLVESLQPPPADPVGPPSLSSRLTALGPDHLIAYFGKQLHILQVQAPTSTPPVAQALRGELLLPNAPNPFSGQTSIRWRPGLEQQLELRIYNVAGRLVRTWKVDGAITSRLLWDGRGQDGTQLASGVYHVSLRAGDRRDVQRVVMRR